MSLTDPVVWLAGLCEIVLPDRTVRLCDGAFVNWTDRGLFTSQDAVLGTIDSVTALSEAVGNEAPSGSLTFLPPDEVAGADLFQPDAQGGAILFWLPEISPEDGTPVGTPELLFSGRIDTLKLRTGTQRTLEVGFISEADRLFWTREGNVLSPAWHKAIWPGETGLDRATGAQTTVPWGAGPVRGQTPFVIGG